MEALLLTIFQAHPGSPSGASIQDLPGDRRFRRERKRLIQLGGKVLFEPVYFGLLNYERETCILHVVFSKHPYIGIHMRKQSKSKTAEQYLICSASRKNKPKQGFMFWFSVVKFLVNIFAIIDKYWPKLLNFFNIDTE